MAPLLGAAAAVIQAVGQLVAAEVESRVAQHPSPGISTPQRSSSSELQDRCRVVVAGTEVLRACPPREPVGRDLALASFSRP